MRRAPGNGWQAGYVETLMVEYGYTLHAAVWGISLTAAFVLAGGRAERLGIDRPGYGDAAAGNARARVKAYFEEHYQII